MNLPRRLVLLVPRKTVVEAGRVVVVEIEPLVESVFRLEMGVEDECCGEVALPRQNLRNRDQLGSEDVDLGLVVQDPMKHRVGGGEERGHRRLCVGLLRHGVPEENAPGGELIDVGAGVLRVSVAAEMIGPLSIDDEPDQIAAPGGALDEERAGRVCGLLCAVVTGEPEDRQQEQPGSRGHPHRESPPVVSKAGATYRSVSSPRRSPSLMADSAPGGRDRPRSHRASPCRRLSA